PPAPLQPTASPAPAASPALLDTFMPVVTTTPAGARFAVIGDYGMAGDAEAAVAALVTGWSPDFVITTGDNNYSHGGADTIDANIGQYYHAFIAPYRGAYGPGDAANRFFPVLGNHDWEVGYPEPYLSYFGLPGNGRYYQLDRGPLSFFMLDSMPDEPDGTAPESAQGRWLQASMAGSVARWKVVVFHHPPFSSGLHGSSGWMQWPFAAWGAQLVLSGHDHSYERIAREGITYVVNGLGGAPRYAPGGSRAEGSQIFYNQLHGAMLVEASATTLHAQFIAQTGEVVDDFRLK
ncbi:MAG: metallophosphoesterase, partial [Chloroflexales bacterium]